MEAVGFWQREGRLVQLKLEENEIQGGGAPLLFWLGQVVKIRGTRGELWWCCGRLRKERFGDGAETKKGLRCGYWV